MFCIDCPVKGTQFCHIANPKAKKYTRAEKEMIRHRIDNGELKEWETSEESVIGTARSVIYAATIKETSWWCYCGRLATGLHTQTCRQYIKHFRSKMEELYNDGN